MEFDFLTKTVGCMPSSASNTKQISGSKHTHSKKKNKKSIGESDSKKPSVGQSLSKINYSTFKSFHDTILTNNNPKK